MTVFAGILGYESFWLGAEGWVAVCSNVLPKDSARLFELAADEQDRDAALALYKKILPVVRWVGGHRYVSASKACARDDEDAGRRTAPAASAAAADHERKDLAASLA